MVVVKLCYYMSFYAMSTGRCGLDGEKIQCEATIFLLFHLEGRSISRGVLAKLAQGKFCCATNDGFERHFLS